MHHYARHCNATAQLSQAVGPAARAMHGQLLLWSAAMRQGSLWQQWRLSTAGAAGVVRQAALHQYGASPSRQLLQTGAWKTGEVICRAAGTLHLVMVGVLCLSPALACWFSPTSHPCCHCCQPAQACRHGLALEQLPFEPTPCAALKHSFYGQFLNWRPL